MKLNVNTIKQIPNHLGFGFCQFGELTKEVKEWIAYWNFKTEKSGSFTNIIIPSTQNLFECFEIPTPYEYVDGFSPNLNKYLHIGHLSNLVIANTFQKLGVGNKFIAILGDTLKGKVNKETALEKYKSYCKDFDYKVSDIFFASKMKLKNQSLLKQGEKIGEDDYSDTKIFEIDGEKIVGIKGKKGGGSTSYFYQDVALAEHLNNSTLYLTGFEQDNHFNLLKKLFPHTNHIGLGLVMLNGQKMSSSLGNVLYLEDFINELLPQFNNNIQLVYNILAGQILKSKPNQIKSINSKLISNPKQSLGLYLSYTLASVKSCGVDVSKITNYKSQKLQVAHIKSIQNLDPSILFGELHNHAKEIMKLKEELYIKGNQENIELFSNLISDLEFGMNNLGMFSIKKV
jgi:arginyl-tRNA synthetase